VRDVLQLERLSRSPSATAGFCLNRPSRTGHPAFNNERPPSIPLQAPPPPTVHPLDNIRRVDYATTNLRMICWLIEV